MSHRTPGPRRARSAATFLSALLTFSLAGALLSPAAFASPTLVGAGSTWVQIALDQWRADIAQQGFSINYQGVGSSSGRAFFINNQVDFAASEIPFQPPEVAALQAAGMSYKYIPDVAGGTSFMYNLHAANGSRITNLKLSATTIAKIFTGQITNWSDPAVTADNGGTALPSQTILPVIRSDGSGTSAQLSFYLAHEAAPVWNAFLAAHPGYATPTSEWPPFPGSVAARGSDGVANYVANDTIGSGSIGYVEYGYATQRGFPVAQVRNASGNYTLPTSQNVSAALAHATLNGDDTQNLGGVYTAPESNAYPVSSYSYMIVRTNGFDPAKGFVLGTWLIYIACAGQKEAPLLGYSPLPPNLVQVVFDAIGKIPGAPAPPAMSACDNPTIQGGGPTPSPTPSTGPSSSPSPTGGNTGGPSSGPSSPGTTGGSPVPGTSTGGSSAAPGTSTGGSSAPGTSFGGTTGLPGSSGSPVPGTSGTLAQGIGGTGLGGTTGTPNSGILAQGVDLSSADLQQRMVGSSGVVGALRAVSGSPFALAALAVFLLVFLPITIKRRLGRVG